MGTILRGFLNLLRRDLAEADVADLALLLHPLQRAERLFERSARVDAVKLVEVDAVELQPAQAHLDALDQIARAAHVFGFRRALAGDAALGGDDQARRIGMKCFADQPLGNLRTVGVGGVDEGNAQLDGAAQHALCFGRVGRLAPGAFAHQAHGSVAEPVDGQIAADEKCAAGGCGAEGVWAFIVIGCYALDALVRELGNCSEPWNLAMPGAYVEFRAKQGEPSHEQPTVSQPASNFLPAV